MRLSNLRNLLCLAALPLLLQAEDTLVGGPYVVGVTSRQATIGWIMKTGEVKAGEKTAPILRSEKVTFTGLKPGARIDYDVLGGKPEGLGSFYTAPTGPAPFKAVVFGDTRTRHDLHRRVMAAMENSGAHFVIHTGDLVADGNDTAQWPLFFQIEGAMLRKSAFFPVLGNHERNNPRFYEFFDVREPYYSFDWGAAHFTILNTDLGNVALSADAREAFEREQTRWFEDDLRKAQKAEFRFVVMHNPPLTAVKKRQGTNRYSESLVPLLEKYKVAAVFNGHDHNYQHHLQNGIRYIVTGGGGAPLYPVDGPMENITQKVVSTEHYVILSVEPGLAKVEAIGLDGAVLDAFEMKVPPVQ